MHLNIRRVLSIIAFAAFIIIAPSIVLYAIGYRPITTSIPQPVGVVIVSALPKKAIVSVNGTEYGAVPRSIPNLLPGVVDVQVRKDGYQPWQKKLDIKPMQATDARNIKLIPIAQDTDELAPDATLFAVSPDASTIAIATAKNDVFLIDQNGKFKTNSIPFKSAISALTWSNDSAHILVETKKSGFSLLEFSNQTITKNVLAILPGDSRIAWDPANNESLIAITKQHELARYNIATSERTILATSCNAYTFIGSQIVIQRTDNTLVKEKTSIDLHMRALSLASSAEGDVSVILETGELVIVDKNNTIIPVAQHAISAQWSQDGSLLLIQTSPNELDIYNYNNPRLRSIPIRESSVLVRLATTITQPNWFPDNAHALYQTDARLMFAEIDSRDHSISTPIATIPVQSQSSIWTAKDMNSIIHIAQQKNMTSLVRTWLVTKEDR